MSFADVCGVASPARAAACDALMERIAEERIERVRVAWCDTHGMLRGKTLTVPALRRALEQGIGIASTILLKDTSDRTAYRVFEAGATDALPGFRNAGNLIVLPDPASFRTLPWAERTGWLQGEAWFDDGATVPIDTRRLLRGALDRLAEAGCGMRCGLEIEFHIYRLVDPLRDPASLDPQHAAWPGEPPAVTMIHPGYNLLSEGWADRCDEPLGIVQRTAEGLGLPLASIEIELGPSQVEAVFDVTDALTAADHMVAFRNGVTQALRRAGYHASFVCRPPFPNVMASGWHLHQSLVDLKTGGNAFVREAPAEGSGPDDAGHWLSAAGESWLAGLLEHGRGGAVFAAPTVNAYGRFRPNAMAPDAVIWGRDNRGAMLRVLGRAGDPATRIENRIGEPGANPYLYLASQIHAGLDGLSCGLAAPPASPSYGSEGVRLPATLGDALDALAADAALTSAFGRPVIDWYTTVKRSELARHDQAEDKDAWQTREYFSRF